jgi:flagellar assembly protein FliH
MSSSAPKLQPVPAGQPATFCYAEVQAGEESSAAKAEQVAEAHLRRRESEAFERGRQSAEQQLRASVEAAATRSREQILHAVNEFARERTVYYRRIEGEVVELALAIARKILHREVQLDPHTLAGIVRVTLEKLDAGTTVNLHVHPQEATDWRHYFASQAEGAPVAEVHEDPALAAGECRIETSLGTTEIGIESQLKEIETGLLDLLAERPDTGGGAPARSASSTVPGVAGGTRR